MLADNLFVVQNNYLTYTAAWSNFIDKKRDVLTFIKFNSNLITFIIPSNFFRKKCQFSKFVSRTTKTKFIYVSHKHMFLTDHNFCLFFSPFFSLFSLSHFTQFSPSTSTDQIFRLFRVSISASSRSRRGSLERRIRKSVYCIAGTVRRARYVRNTCASFAPSRSLHRITSARPLSKSGEGGSRMIEAKR